MVAKANTQYVSFDVSAVMPLAREMLYTEVARILGRAGLVGPPTELDCWQTQGNCRDYDSELFFSPADKWRASDEERIGKARAACAGCLVAGDCLEFAFRSGDRFAIMAGTTPDERANPKLLKGRLYRKG